MSVIYSAMPCRISFNDNDIINPTATFCGIKPKALFKMLEDMNWDHGKDGNLIIVLPLELMKEATLHTDKFRNINQVVFAKGVKWHPDKKYMRCKNIWEWARVKKYDWGSIIPHKTLGGAINRLYQESVVKYSEKMPYNEAVDFAEHQVLGLTIDEVLNRTLTKPQNVKVKDVWDWE